MGCGSLHSEIVGRRKIEPLFGPGVHRYKRRPRPTEASVGRLPKKYDAHHHIQSAPRVVGGHHGGEGVDEGLEGGGPHGRRDPRDRPEVPLQCVQELHVVLRLPPGRERGRDGSLAGGDGDRRASHTGQQMATIVTCCCGTEKMAPSGSVWHSCECLPVQRGRPSPDLIQSHGRTSWQSFDRVAKETSNEG